MVFPRQEASPTANHVCMLMAGEAAQVTKFISNFLKVICDYACKQRLLAALLIQRESMRNACYGHAYSGQWKVRHFVASHGIFWHAL